MLLDEKAKDLLNYYYEKLISSSFDEKDIYAFFMLIREFTDKNMKWIREIGDLIAHRQRIKGEVHCNLGAIRKVDKWHQGKVPDSSGLNVVNFINELNSLLRSMNYGELSESTIKDMLLCVFSLMQHSQYIGKDGNSRVGRLIILITERQVLLVSDETGNDIHVPVGIIDNAYLIADIVREKGIVHCSKPITVNRRNGCLVINYDNQIL